jgi:hypothetical protein
MGIGILPNILVELVLAVGVVRKDFEKEFIWEYRKSSRVFAFRT